jgi:hypothetical protein
MARATEALVSRGILVLYEIVYSFIAQRWRNSALRQLQLRALPLIVTASVLTHFAGSAPVAEPAFFWPPGTATH